jgi:hypothetical protein
LICTHTVIYNTQPQQQRVKLIVVLGP